MIEFKVSDMLRAKCMFKNVGDINYTAGEIKKGIEDKKLTLVEIDNRLRGKTNTSDLVFKILVGETITELQLPIEFNVIQN
jgi:hypothetical protein